ncbi:hypothetical protein Syun_028619 [Stephania yunnanensis]|uniref:Kinesin motor domain-containing protein n=1 Tax=Stephania yunnanensis TaxID=152371 RepID=A0AAP0E6J2_9MAGN
MASQIQDQINNNNNNNDDGGDNYAANENAFAANSAQFPPPRTPLNAIPDPSQVFKGLELDSRVRVSHKKVESLSHWNPRIRGKSQSEPNSAQTTPARSVVRVGVCDGVRSPRRGSCSRGLRGNSIAVPYELAMEVPHFELVEDPQFWMDHNVQVLIRIRPVSIAERAVQGNARCLRQESANTLTWLGHPETRFTFDHIACETISQEKLFKVAGLPMVENCMSGYNSCMFAYGQTGSGKTYTMMGEILDMEGKLNEDCGITPRIFEYLFSRIRDEEEHRRDEHLKYTCKCSFLEIYNEQITDLLEPSSTNLQIREDMRKGVYVENLAEYEVKTVNDVIELLLKGSTNRKIAATNMNCESSRSHSVFTCTIESQWVIDSMTHLRFGRLNLVDLAGSERQKSSGAEGERLKEAANINRSLSTLGLVIMTLVDVAHGKSRHVPYRDSRLTFLLQDSLGGNSKTTIIANISPSICSASETLSTLKFAQRAKLIQNNAKVNEDASGDIVALQREIQQLKDQLSFLLKNQDFYRSQSFCLSGDLHESYDSSKEEKNFDHQNERNISEKKLRDDEATVVDSLGKEKMAETAAWRLEAEVEQLSRLVHQYEEDAQSTKIILRLREGKIKRLELLTDGLLSADDYLIEENSALSKEIQLLQERTDKNPELIRLATENTKLREELQMFQDFCEQAKKERLSGEVSKLSDQEIIKELENCRRNLDCCLAVNVKLAREVDDLRRELNKHMSCSEDAFHSARVEILSAKTYSEDEVASYWKVDDEVSQTKSDEKMGDMTVEHNGTGKELMDVRSLNDAMKHEQLEFLEELVTLQRKNRQCVELWMTKDVGEIQSMIELTNSGPSELYQKAENPVHQEARILREDMGKSTRSHLQSVLDKVNMELQEARTINRQYRDDHSLREQVCEQVEEETAKTILHLQEFVIHQEELQKKLILLSEENTKLTNALKATEGEMRTLSEGWEKATLELTNFIIDGCRSMEDASEQIENIKSSFPECKGWISEHVERAAKVIADREKTIGLLQLSLEEAQEMGNEMKLNLSSLKGATLAITEVRWLESDGNAKEVTKLRELLTEKILAIQDLDHKLKNREHQMNEAEECATAAIKVLKRLPYLLNYVQRKVTGRNLDLISAYSVECNEHEVSSMLDEVDAQAIEEIKIQVEMTRQRIFETQKSLNPSYMDGEKCLFASISAILDTSCSYLGFSLNLIKQINSMKDNAVNLMPQNPRSFILNTEEAEADCSHTTEMLDLKLTDVWLAADKKIKAASCWFHNLEEAHATLKEADLMLNELLKANENARNMTEKWKHAGEELMTEKVWLIEEVQQLKSSICLKEIEGNALQDQMNSSLLDMRKSVSSLEGSFLQMQKDVEEMFKVLYSDILSFGQDLLKCIYSSRSSVEDMWSEILGKEFALFVMCKCYTQNYLEKLSIRYSDAGFVQGGCDEFESIDCTVEKKQKTIEGGSDGWEGRNTFEKDDRSELMQQMLSNSEEEAIVKFFNEEPAGPIADHLTLENLSLKRQLARKDVILKGLLFDFRLLQESTSNVKDYKDETEQLVEALKMVQCELSMKAAQFNELLLQHNKLEAQFTDTEAALLISNSRLEQANEMVDTLSKKNTELIVALEDLYASHVNAEEQLEEKKEAVASLEKEILQMASSVEEKVLSSIEDVEAELSQVTIERNCLREEITSLNDKLEMANALADENEAIAVEARQVSEASKIYAEQKEEEAKILEHSVEELEHTINVLEKKVREMGEEVERYHIARDELELEVQDLRLRMMTVENVTESIESDGSQVDLSREAGTSRVSSERIRDLQESRKQIRLLEKEKADQDKEIKECKEYISELALHAEAQASQYQQKYKTLEAMVREIQKHPSTSNSTTSTLEKLEKGSIRTRGSSSPFRCLTNLVQQMNLEKDQELSSAKLQIEELEALASTHQKEVCRLNARLAATENMTHDVIRDLLGVKLDMTNYANLIDQYQVQKLVEEAQLRNEESTIKDQEIEKLKNVITDLIEERKSCIDEINQREARILTSQVTIEQLRYRDQMLTAQNEMLKMDKANLRRKVSEMDEMMKHFRPLNTLQQIPPPLSHKENQLVRANNDELSRRLSNCEKLLSRVNDDLAQYHENDGMDSCNRTNGDQVLRLRNK